MVRGAVLFRRRTRRNFRKRCHRDDFDLVEEEIVIPSIRSHNGAQTRRADFSCAKLAHF